jgi:hypothetical protein
MNSTKPPRLAAWILQHFGPELNQEALAGDLNEAMAQGRSSGWYWRQVLAAVRWPRLLCGLLILAAWSWWMTLPDMWIWGRPLVSRPLDMAIFMVGVLAASYVPDMLRARLRGLLAVLVVVFFCLLYRGRYAHFHAIYSHYNILAVILTYGLVFHRKAITPSPYHLTWRELLLGDQGAERGRMIAKLEQSMREETDPEVRHAYAESIAALKRKLPAVKVAE